MPAIQPERAVSILDTALQFQRYRRIATETIHPSGAIEFPTSVSSNIDAALQSLAREPNWIEIGRQLALLKTSKAFKDVYIRRDVLDTEILVVHWWGGGLLSLDTVEAQTNAVWDILRSIRPIIGKFEIDDDLKENIKKLVEEIKDSQTREYKIIVSVLETALMFANSKQGPTGLLLNLALGGLSNELQNAIIDPFRQRKLMRGDITFSWIEPTLNVIAWDVPIGKIIGNTYRDSLNPTQLERNIKYILSQ